MTVANPWYKKNGTFIYCIDCGLSHTPKNRQRLIARMVEVGATPTEIQAEYSCFYPSGRRGGGERRLYRDLAAIKGVKP